MKVRITDHQAKLIRNAGVHDEYTVWSIKGTRIESFGALYRAGLITAPTYGAKLTDQGLSAKWSLENDPTKRLFYVLETPAATPTTENGPAVDVKKITNDVEPLTEDITTNANMFDPELTYYADGTRVLMTWTGGTREGTTFGKYAGHAPYAFQAVRWDDGNEDGVAPHVLTRVETAPATTPEYTGIVRSVRPGGAVVELADGDCLSVEIPRGRSATVGEVYMVTTETFQRLEPGVPEWEVMGEIDLPTEDEKARVRRDVAASRVEAANAGHLVWRRNGGGSWRSLDGRWVVTPGPVIAWKGRPDTWSVEDGSGLKEPFDRKSLADAQRACQSFSVSRPAPVPPR